jgi:hypothetical protein
MSWSLDLQNGDLSLSGTNLGRVTGSQKLVQDLRCFILEKMGTDESHPWYGSLIDGGINETGEFELGFIGETDWEIAALTVQAEIRRIVGRYQELQARRLEDDRLTYGSSTLDANEVLLGISGIQITQAQDKMMVTIGLNTGTGSSLTLNVPLDI